MTIITNLYRVFYQVFLLILEGKSCVFRIDHYQKRFGHLAVSDVVKRVKSIFTVCTRYSYIILCAWRTRYYQNKEERASDEFPVRVRPYERGHAYYAFFRQILKTRWWYPHYGFWPWYNISMHTNELTWPCVD